MTVLAATAMMIGVGTVSDAYASDAYRALSPTELPGISDAIHIPEEASEVIIDAGKKNGIVESWLAVKEYQRKTVGVIHKNGDGVLQNPAIAGIAKILDPDGDGIRNDIDNCPGVANADQFNTAGGVSGDACEDADADGVLDAEDNCVDVANADQADEDADGFGDACDLDLGKDVDPPHPLPAPTTMSAGEGCALMPGGAAPASAVLGFLLLLAPIAAIRRGEGPR